MKTGSSLPYSEGGPSVRSDDVNNSRREENNDDSFNEEP